MKKSVFLILSMCFLCPMGISASNPLEIEIETVQEKIFCDGYFPVRVKVTNLGAEKQQVVDLNHCGQPLRWQWKSDSPTLTFSKKCQDKSFELESKETHIATFYPFVSCRDQSLQKPISFKLGYWGKSGPFWSDFITFLVQEDRKAPLEMEIQSVKKETNEQYQAVVAFTNIGEEKVELEVCTTYCSNRDHKDPWAIPDELKDKISLTQMSSLWPPKIKKMTLKPHKQERIKRDFVRTSSSAIGLQLGYKFYSYKMIWSKPIALPSLVKIEDGINQEEAGLLAMEYFLKQFGGCGFPEKPADRGAYWECQPYVGYGGIPHPKKIRIDKRTGEARLA